jgi:hypothetical protein
LSDDYDRAVGAAFGVAETPDEVARIFTEAGWTPIAEPIWKGGFAFGGFVGGIDPGGGAHVKHWERDVHGPDYPDTAPEAAQWLVARYLRELNPLTTEATLAAPVVNEVFHVETEAEHPLQSPEELTAIDATSALFEAAPDEAAPDPGLDVRNDPDAESDFVDLDAGLASEGDGGDLDILPPELRGEPDLEVDSFIEGEFGDPEDDTLSPELLGADDEYMRDPVLLGDAQEPVAETPEATPDLAGQDRFIGLDDLDRRRSLRIGDVVREAERRMPATIDYPLLSELRNFAMGVSEGRWNNDPLKQAELEALEELDRSVRRLESARDAKVAFLIGATREQIEAFDPEANWP